MFTIRTASMGKWEDMPVATEADAARLCREKWGADAYAFLADGVVSITRENAGPVIGMVVGPSDWSPDPALWLDDDEAHTIMRERSSAARARARDSADPGLLCEHCAVPQDRADYRTCVAGQFGYVCLHHLLQYEGAVVAAKRAVPGPGWGAWETVATIRASTAEALPAESPAVRAALTAFGSKSED